MFPPFLTSHHSLRKVALVASIWSIVFAVVHVYWAAGGDSAGGDGDLSAGASAYIAFIALVGAVAAVIAYGLYRVQEDGVERRRLRLLARLGGAMLLLGVVAGVARWAADGGLGDDGAAGVVITAYFFAGGVLFSLLGWNPRGAEVRS